MHKLPHLYQNRFGVYYLRLIRQGRRSSARLRTKDFRQAKILALAFNLEPRDGSTENHGFQSRR